MSLPSLVILPSPLLREQCLPVTEITSEIETLFESMTQVMRKSKGIGLAACQIGVLKQMIVMDTSSEEAPHPVEYFLNPTLVWASEETNLHEEGCLSIPSFYARVERPARVIVSFTTRDGIRKEEMFEGLRATCLQHEMDHLKGVLFIDYLPRLIRSRVIKKFWKQNRLKEHTP